MILKKNQQEKRITKLIYDVIIYSLVIINSILRAMPKRAEFIIATDVLVVSSIVRSFKVHWRQCQVTGYVLKNMTNSVKDILRRRNISCFLKPL